MTSSTSSFFEGCDLAALEQIDLARLSRCWREDKVRMVHRSDRKVDITLTCASDQCLCASALRAKPSGR
jgi:hypothetical protein